MTTQHRTLGRGGIGAQPSRLSAARKGNKKNNKCDKMQNENSIGGVRGDGTGGEGTRRSAQSHSDLLSQPVNSRDVAHEGEVQGSLLIDDGALCN